MFRNETQKRLQEAIFEILAHGQALPGYVSLDSRELADNVELLSRLVADQLWSDGYEIHVRGLAVGVLTPSSLD